jgi:Zn-finger protein
MVYVWTCDTCVWWHVAPQWQTIHQNAIELVAFLLYYYISNRDALQRSVEHRVSTTTASFKKRRWSRKQLSSQMFGVSWYG